MFETGLVRRCPNQVLTLVASEAMVAMWCGILVVTAVSVGVGSDQKWCRKQVVGDQGLHSD